ncbi:MAG TPA: sulfotransferase [Rhizomicrobium sp.]|jgi:tetratricopeptide (TPR) repeat protein
MSQSFDATPQATADAVHAVAAAIGAANFPHAQQLAEAALARGLIHPAFFNARAISLERQGRDEDALASFLQARALSPKDPRLLNAIGLCFMRLHRLDDALEAFDEAIRIDPANAITHQRKGIVLGMGGRQHDAERAHRRSLQLQPRNADALASLASIAARKGDVQPAKQLATRALGIDPSNATAHVVLAEGEIFEGEFGTAETRLRDVLRTDLPAHGKAVALGVLGDALDGLSLTDEAFSAYEAANTEHKRLAEKRFLGKPSALDVLDALIQSYETAGWNEHAGDSTAAGEDTGAHRHVFLLGFLRSGTTVLEQVLETHENVATLEEEDFLAGLAQRFLTSRAGLDDLHQLDGDALAFARSQYWENVRRHGIRFEGKVFVDKNPLNTLKLPLIWKLFPKAKVLFAVRDPRDVVLSCFRRQFEVDLAKMELLSLEGTAQFYDRAMRFGDLCRKTLLLEFYTHRYEDMIADFEQSVRAVCAFLEIPWQDSMIEFADTARAQNIRSPSAGQVRRGLYDGVGQWKRYEKQLAPIVPVLRPWIEKFGYGEE